MACRTMPQDVAQQQQQQPAGQSAAALSARPDLPAFYPVNTVAWEDQICWRGNAAPPATTSAGPDGAGLQHGAPPEEPPGELGLPPAQQVQLQEQQQLQHGGGWPAASAGELPAAQLADIAAMFQQHDPQQQLAANGMHAQLTGMSSGGAPEADELPGLESMTAAESLARAAAESDEEETLALPIGPLLRLERLAAAAGAEGLDRSQLLAGLPKPYGEATARCSALLSTARCSALLAVCRFCVTCVVVLSALLQPTMTVGWSASHGGQRLTPTSSGELHRRS